MIQHLLNRGGQLDFTDTKKVILEQDLEWDTNEVPQVFFNRVEKAIRQLKRAGIQSNLNECRDMALYFFKASEEYDTAVREWEAKPAADETWANIKIFISTKYVKENKQNKLAVKQFKANLIKEQAKATKELIANLTEAHAKQMEILIKSMTDAMREMMNLMKTAMKVQQTQTTKRKRIHGRRNRKYTKTHQFANTATENILPNPKANAGNSKPMHPPAHPIGSHPKAPEGAQGP
jgi:hypothetical protein